MNIAIIAGDGIGKDVTAEAVRVLGTVNDVFGSKLTLRAIEPSRAAPTPRGTATLCDDAKPRF